MHRFLCTPVLVVALAMTVASTPAAPAQEAAPTLSIEQVERGQTGYGLSVFEGSEPERFEVEVLGVMKDTSPGRSMILARLSGQGLEETGVIAGMSGSPVYLDDRLIGAVAFAWPFSNGAVGGITPIDAMLELSGAEPGDPTGARIPQSVSPIDLRVLDADGERLAREIARLVPALPDDARSGLVWSLAGFGPASRSFLGAALPNMARAGFAPSGDAGESASALGPGSAVAGVLVDGDLKLAVTGTVTERIGDEIFAFGHPFLGQGPIRLPMAHAEIITVLSSQMVSFKIANVGTVIGSFGVDRTSGVHGRVGRMIEMIPLRITVDGLGRNDFRMLMADVPAYLPVLVATSGLGALDSTSRSLGSQGLDLTARWQLDGHEPIELDLSFEGANAGFSAVTFLFLMTNYMVNNPVEEARLEEVSVDLVQYAEPRTARIVRGFAHQSSAAPGETVEVTLEMEPFKGEAYKETFPVEIPTDLREGIYTLLVGDGVTMDTVRQTIEQVVPEDFDQSLAMVRQFKSNRDLVTLGLAPSWGLSMSGRVLPQLPASVRRLWQGVTPGVATELGLAIVDEQTRRFDVPLAGGVRIDISIERPSVVRPDSNHHDRERG